MQKGLAIAALNFTDLHWIISDFGPLFVQRSTIDSILANSGNFARRTCHCQRRSHSSRRLLPKWPSCLCACTWTSTLFTSGWSCLARRKYLSNLPRSNDKSHLPIWKDKHAFPAAFPPYLLYFEWSTLPLICHSFWHVFWKYIWYNLLKFYSGILSGILSDILSWHSI